MKKIMIIAMIFAIAIFSLVYSGVLNYYGKIVGNVNVQPPVFYAHSETESYGGETYYLLKPNAYPDGKLEEIIAGVFQSKAGEYTTIIDRGWLFPEVSSWYRSKWIFYYEVKIENANKARFFTKIYKFDTSTNSKNLIVECPPSEYTSSTTYTTVTSICDIPPISLNSNERILVEYYASIDINADTLGKVYLKIDDPNSSNPTRIEISTS